MPEKDVRRDSPDVASSAPAPGEKARLVPEAYHSASSRPRGQWLFYGLGLSLQTFLWFLLFLAIAVAVLVGGKLTEFRYVGF